MENKQCSVYCFTNLINGKKYIGSTIQPLNIRYNQHIYNATHQNAYQYNYPLYGAMRKYGFENFDFSVLCQKECTEEEIRVIEKNYIQSLNTIAPNGYNQTTDTAHPINDIVTYEKIRTTKREKAKQVAQIDKNQNIIKIFRSIIDCAEELKLDEKKIAACCRGERRSTQSKYFCWIDAESNLLIPEYSRDKYKGDPGTTQKQITNREVAKIDKDTNEVLAIYDSIALASRENACDSSGISKVCQGKRSSCGGFKWKYIEIKENKYE